MKCSKCGYKLTKADVFCPECGKKVPKLGKKLKEKPVRKDVKEHGKVVKCLNCGVESKGIPDNLKCSRCGAKYVCDKKHDLYLLKDSKCEKCHEISRTIATKHFCDKCGAKYVYDKGSWWRPESYYLKSRVYIYDKFYCSSFIAEIYLFLIALAFVFTFVFAWKGKHLIYSIIPLIVALYMAYKIFKRLKKSGFNFEKIIGVSEEK